MKNLISKEEKDRIDSICTNLNIENYNITSDGSIDVNGDVNLALLKFNKLPLTFNNVSGNFNCSVNKLTTLEGSPITVGGDFSCSCNQLTSLIGGPSSVGGNFHCYGNELTSLEGTPHIIGGDINYIHSEIISTYSGDIDIELGGKFRCIGDELPQLLQDNIVHIKLILKYQRHFEIWNADLSLNDENFQELLDEIKDGLE